MTKQAIGVFDSGLGGLTAVKELIRVLPNEDIIYFGDTGRVPYGNRSQETITKYAFQDAAFLMHHNVKMIIAACGTVSSVATELKSSLPVLFTGVVAPTAISAVNATVNGKIGVIGTTATIKSGSYRKEILKINKDIEIFEKDCPLFVPLVENGFIDHNDPILNLTIKRYLSEIVEKGIDTLILGCTHYPIIREAISNVIGNSIKIIDSGRETAIYSANYLKENNLLDNSGKKGSYSFYVSDSTEGFSNVAQLFLGSNVNYNVSKINIEAF